MPTGSGWEQPPLSLKWSPQLVTNQCKFISKMYMHMFYTTSTVCCSHHSSKPGHIPVRASHKMKNGNVWVPIEVSKMVEQLVLMYS